MRGEGVEGPEPRIIRMTIGLDLQQQLDEEHMAEQKGAVIAQISLYIESIENGFVLTYSRGGQQRKRFAANVPEIGEQVVVAVVESELRGAMPAQ